VKHYERARQTVSCNADSDKDALMDRSFIDSKIILFASKDVQGNELTGHYQIWFVET
jgi:hypothetical protein